MRKLFIALSLQAAISIQNALLAQPTTEAVSGFGDLDKLEYRLDVSKFSDDGQSVEIDTANSGNWSVWLKTKKGVILPNKNYIISFSYQILPGADERSRLHLLVRPLSKITPEDDCLRVDESTVSEKMKKVVLSVKTQSAGDYAFQIHMGGKFKAKLKNLKIYEGSFEKFVPFSEHSAQWNGKIKDLPTGAKEFDVELPTPQKEIVVNAEDFGVTPSCTTVRESLNKAIEHCKKIGASKLALKKGIYYVSQNDPIKFEKMADFTFDGGGSTFVFYKKYGNNFNVNNCLRVRLTNFNIDWDWDKDPIASIVKIENIGKDADGNFIDIKFVDYDKFPKQNVRFVIMTPYDPVAKAVGVEGGKEYNFGNNDGKNNPKNKWLSGNQIRVWVRQTQPFFKVGGYCRLVHYSYDMGCITLDSNKHLTMDNINIYSCCGHGIAIHGSQQYWHFKNFNIVIPNDGNKRRCITSSADHCHIINSKGFFKMENCEFSYGCDDCINMHDNSVFARKTSEFALTGKRMGNNLKVGDTVEFRHGDYSPANYTGKIASIKLIDKKNNIWETTFENPLPEVKDDGFVLFNHDFNTHNIIVRNCFFHHNRARGILILARDVTIENCRFWRNEQAGIKIETGYTYDLWCEGYGVNNIKISNNTFDTVNPTGTRNQNFERDIFIGTYLKRDPSSEHTSYPILSNILIENNTFKDTFGLCAYIASAGNVIVRNNSFYAETPRETPQKYRGGFRIQNSENIKVVNNRYNKSPLFKELGVSYDTRTSKGIVVEGNIID